MIRWHLLSNCTTSLLCGTTTYTQQLRSTNSNKLQTMHWWNCLCIPGSSMTMTLQKLASLVALLGSWQSSLWCSWMAQRLWIWGGPRCFWGEQQFWGIGQQGTHGNIFSPSLTSYWLLSCSHQLTFTLCVDRAIWARENILPSISARDQTSSPSTSTFSQDCLSLPTSSHSSKLFFQPWERLILPNLYSISNQWFLDENSATCCV